MGICYSARYVVVFHSVLLFLVPATLKRLKRAFISEAYRSFFFPVIQRLTATLVFDSELLSFSSYAAVFSARS